MKIIKWLVIVFIGIPLLIAVMLMSVNSGSFNTSNKDSATPTPAQRELVGTVNFDGQLFHVRNEENRNWTNCWLTLNKDYHFPQDRTAARFSVNAMDTYPLDPGDIALGDGTRFNSFITKPSNVSISCDEGFGYWTW